MRAIVLPNNAGGFLFLEAGFSVVVIDGVEVFYLQKTDTIVIFGLFKVGFFKEKTYFAGSSFPPEMHFILLKLCNFLAGHKFLASHLKVGVITVIRFGITSILHTQKL